MASTKENVPLAPPQPLPRQTSSGPRPPPPTPLRPKMANGATEPPPLTGSGVKCTCFRLPSRTSKSKKPLPPPHPAPKLRSASSRSAPVAPDKSAATGSRSQSQQVTFRASSSLTTWWPPSPSAADSAGAMVIPAAAGSGGRSVVAPRRGSASSAVAPTTMKAGVVSTSPSSFSHWRCRSPSSSRVIPHGERASFSFAASPASSCMSTPKIPQGWQQK